MVCHGLSYASSNVHKCLHGLSLRMADLSSSGPFRFLEDHPSQNQGSFQSVKSLDICFCLGCDALDTSPRYFKVGELSLIPLRLMNSSLFLQVPGREGQLAITSTEYFIDDGFLPLAEPLLPAGAHADVRVKLLLDNTLTASEADCFSVPYSAYSNPSSQHFQLLSLRDGNSEAEVQSFFRLTRQEGDGPEMVFSEGVSFRRPGRVALCYCGEFDGENACSSSSFWRVLLHFTVRGPKLADLGAQNWTVSPGEEQTAWVMVAGLKPFWIPESLMGLASTTYTPVI